jgi:RNA polymerase sigma-70 factor (ECF subfamily)
MASPYSPQDRATIKLLSSAASDEILVAAAKVGDRPAFAELWERHRNTAFNIAFRITRNRDDAEDAIQESWMRAYIHLSKFDGRAKFSTWLTRIAINSALMILRRKCSRRESFLTAMSENDRTEWEIPDHRQNVEELFVGREIEERLKRAIAHLRPTLRDVVEIHQSRANSVKEVASLAGISVPAAKARLSRARAILRGSLGEATKQPSPSSVSTVVNAPQTDM